jgi:hypothetical protein
MVISVAQGWFLIVHKQSDGHPSDLMRGNMCKIDSFIIVKKIVVKLFVQIS